MIAAYVRVSTDRQRYAATIDMQRKKIQRYYEQYCQSTDTLPRVLRWFEDDGTSGKVPLEQRHGGKALLETIQSGKTNRLLVYDLSRLARDSEDGIAEGKRITAKGKVITTVSDGQSYDDSQASRLNLGMRMLFAENDWESLRKKTMDARDKLAPEGFWMGGIVPFGFRTVSANKRKRLEIDPTPIPGTEITEARVLETIYSKIANQGQTCQKVSDYLNARNLPTCVPGKHDSKTAAHWRPARVRDLIVNPLYKGEVFWGKRRATSERGRRVRLTVNPKDAWRKISIPAIVDAETWERANANLRKNQLDRMAHAKTDYLLRRLIRCAVCGRHYIGTGTYYVCVGRHGARHLSPDGTRCPSPSVRRDQIEALVWGDVEAFIYKPGPVLQTLRQQCAEAERTGQSEKEIAKLEAQIARCVEQDRRNVTHLNQDVITLDDFRRERERISKQRGLLEKDLQAMRQLSTDAKASARRLKTAGQLLEKMRDQLEQGGVSFESKRRIVELLVDNIVVGGSTGKPQVEVEYAFDGDHTRYFGGDRVARDRSELEKAGAEFGDLADNVAEWEDLRRLRPRLAPNDTSGRGDTSCLLRGPACVGCPPVHDRLKGAPDKCLQFFENVAHALVRAASILVSTPEPSNAQASPITA
jgi:site-specific DNA recombinase